MSMKDEINNQLNSDADNTWQKVVIRDYFLKKAYPQPDVLAELKAFRQKQQSRRKTKVVFVSFGFLSGIVAALLILLFLHNWDMTSFFSSENRPLVAFQARVGNSTDEVTLQQSGSAAVTVVGSSVSKLAQAGALLNAKDKKLIYAGNQNTTEVVMQTLSVPRCKTFKVVLSDGTEVWMNAQSQLCYPNRFTGKQRVVQLQGEAYFKVAHNAKCPFIVKTNQLQTRVLGTEFNLRNYSAIDTHVTLLKGSVEVSNVLGTSKRRIKPGEDAQLTSNHSFKVKQVDTEEYCMWKDGYFYFDNVSFIEITQELGRWYNVGVVFNNRKAIDTKLFFVADRHGSLQEAVDMLNNIKKVHIYLHNNQMIIE